MSKERARRREERQRAAAEAAARHAAQLAKQKRRRERSAALRRILPRSRPNGVLARRARVRSSILALLLLVLVLVVWATRPDWAARIGVIVVCVLVYPVLRAVLFPRP